MAHHLTKPAPAWTAGILRTGSPRPKDGGLKDAVRPEVQSDGSGELQVTAGGIFRQGKDDERTP